ncbi:MAG: M23 family metallopeptidase [Desertimonas sp.]
MEAQAGARRRTVVVAGVSVVAAFGVVAPMASRAVEATPTADSSTTSTTFTTTTTTTTVVETFPPPTTVPNSSPEVTVSPTPSTPTAAPTASTTPTPSSSAPASTSTTTAASPDPDEVLSSLEPLPDTGETRVITFPVVGRVSYWNDWGVCRDGCTRYHKGNDLIGDPLQPIVAMVDGTVHHLIDHPTAGYGVAIVDAQGWRYDVYHINNDSPGTDDGGDRGSWRFALGVEAGASVRAGQLIGWMGDSGNAEHSVPHAHVEIHRPDGTAINPFWSLQLAERAAVCTDNPRQVTAPSTAVDPMVPVSGLAKWLRENARVAINLDGTVVRMANFGYATDGPPLVVGSGLTPAQASCAAVEPAWLDRSASTLSGPEPAVAVD